MHEMIDMCMNLIGFMLMNDACDIVKHVKDIIKVFLELNVTLTGNLILK